MSADRQSLVLVPGLCALPLLRDQVGGPGWRALLSLERGPMRAGSSMACLFAILIVAEVTGTAIVPAVAVGVIEVGLVVVVVKW